MGHDSVLSENDTINDCTCSDTYSWCVKLCRLSLLLKGDLIRTESFMTTLCAPLTKRRASPSALNGSEMNELSPIEIFPKLVTVKNPLYGCSLEVLKTWDSFDWYKLVLYIVSLLERIRTRTWEPSVLPKLFVKLVF